MAELLIFVAGGVALAVLALLVGVVVNLASSRLQEHSTFWTWFTSLSALRVVGLVLLVIITGSLLTAVIPPVQRWVAGGMREVPRLLGDEGGEPSAVPVTSVSAPSATTSSPRPVRVISVQALDELAYDVQVDRFVSALGPPADKDRDDNYEKWTWDSPDGVVSAFVDDVDQVKVYSVLARTNILAARLPDSNDHLRLTRTPFASLSIDPIDFNYAYPANARWYYEEEYVYSHDARPVGLLLSVGFASNSDRHLPLGLNLFDFLSCSASTSDSSVTPTSRSICDEQFRQEFREQTPVGAFAVGSSDAMEEIRTGGKLSLIDYAQ